MKSRMAAPTLVINGISAPDAADRCPRVTAQQSEERGAPSLFRNSEPNSTVPDKATLPEWLRAHPQDAGIAAAQVRDSSPDISGRSACEAQCPVKHVVSHASPGAYPHALDLEAFIVHVRRCLLPLHRLSRSPESDLGVQWRIASPTEVSHDPALHSRVGCVLRFRDLLPCLGPAHHE